MSAPIPAIIAGLLISACFMLIRYLGNKPKSPLSITATYGRGFKATDTTDTYAIRIYVNAFAGPEAADERVQTEIAAFMKEKGFTTYEILDRKTTKYQQCFEYIVRFC